MIVSNYLFFTLWAYIYTNFETMENLRPKFFNCVSMCLPNENTMRLNFSTKILKESLIFNCFFGMMIGIFLNEEAVFSFRGLYSDKNFRKYLIWVLIYIFFWSPMILTVQPKLQHPILNFSRSLMITLLIGVSTTTLYLWLLKKLNLYPQIIIEDEETTIYILDMQDEEAWLIF